MGDLSSAIPSTRITLPLLLLAAQVLPKCSPLSLVRIHMLINGFMADGQLRGNLFWTPLHAQQGIHLIFHPRRYRVGVATVLRSIGRHLASLFGSIPTRATVAAQFSADGGLVSIQQFGYLRLIVSSFHKGVNLISFSLAEVFVFHKQQRHARSRSLEC